MAKEKTFVCRYTHCKHETKNIPEEEAVHSGTGYWHEDCLKESLAIREVIDLFQKKCNPLVVMPQLRKTINNIVYEKGIDAQLLLFGVRYYIDHKIPLNYPGGLYYVLQNKDVQKEWAKQSVKAMKCEFDLDKFVSESDTTASPIDYKDTNKSKFSNVLGRT